MEKVKEKARTIAAHELEVADEDLEWLENAWRVKGVPDKAKTIPEIAFSAWHAHSLPAGTAPHLNATAVYDPPNFTLPGAPRILTLADHTRPRGTGISPS